MLQPRGMTTARDSCGARRTARRLFGRVVVAFLSFAVTAAGVRWAQIPLRELTKEARFEAFVVQKDEVDAVFVGSSRIQRGVSPLVVDRRLSMPGQAFRSFNLGIPGMRSFEADALIRRILDARPERLRFLIVEIPRFEPALSPVEGATQRFVEWHDVTSTWKVLRALWRSDRGLLPKLAETANRLRALLLRASNYATSARFSRAPNPVWERIVGGWASQRGFRALDETVQGAQRRRARFEKFRGRYRQRVATLVRLEKKGQLADPAFLDTYDVDSLREQVERIEAAGIVPIYLATPQLIPGPDFQKFEREGLIEHVISLGSPLEHPKLFSTAYRFDREHMNAAGAVLLSEKIADRLAPILRAGPNEDGD